jgi:hypothetical protein
MNFNPEFARWLLHQFNNPYLIKECFFECGHKPMRMILAGVVYCAQLKVYELEKDQLADYWTDLHAADKVEKPRQTTLGNLILLFLYLLPEAKRYNKNHGAFF